MILFLSNVDTELLAMRSVVEDLPAELAGVRWLHPERIDGAPDLDGVGSSSCGCSAASTLWRRRCRRCRAGAATPACRSSPSAARRLPTPTCWPRSTVPAGVALEAHRYLAAGGPANVANLVRFLSDTVLLTGFGFDPPDPVADVGVWDGAGIGAPGRRRRPERPLVAVVFYRAHLVAGNTTYVADLCGALEDAGADALAIWTYSLRARRRRRVDGAASCAGSTAST